MLKRVYIDNVMINYMNTPLQTISDHLYALQLVRPHQINFMFLGWMDGWKAEIGSKKVMNLIKML